MDSDSSGFDSSSFDSGADSGGYDAGAADVPAESPYDSTPAEAPDPSGDPADMDAPEPVEGAALEAVDTLDAVDAVDPPAYLAAGLVADEAEAGDGLAVATGSRRAGCLAAALGMTCMLVAIALALIH